MAIKKGQSQPELTLESLIDACPIRMMYCDPITLCLFEDPVIAADKQTHERASIQAHIDECARKGKPLVSPLSNAPMAPTIMPTVTMKQFVEMYVEGKKAELKRILEQQQQGK